ncbi:N-acetyltransferase domain-containing protein [Fusarium falciforme]|uniref:N-acetyltransferase domain-containing protein n=1 Tax=Fusarium falciforme TaxID=195108 RepID=UPI0022FFD1B2|nr:N-acetyltransferase domain-containing protein [Fusarium falciforme]WAO91844.1 N-acetyltransferase domain-containing protein [Fusarium falciforme]
MAAVDYTFFHVSKTTSIEESARLYRDLRLKALQTSPESFSSTYEIESAFTEDDWIKRLLEGDRENFVCAATSREADSTSSVEWVGQLTIRGPVSRNDYVLPEASGQTAPGLDEDEERWQMLSLFNLPEHRGKGLGQKLCQEALRHLQKTRKSPNILVRLMVKPQNTVTVHLYEKLGFETVGKCTLAEALVANGDGHLLPEDTTDPKYSTRAGLIMTLRISRT